MPGLKLSCVPGGVLYFIGEDRTRVSLKIDIPDQLERQLRTKFGDRLDQEAKEALAVELYRQSKLSIGQVAEMLGFGVLRAEAWLSERGVELPMTVEDLAEELDDSRRPSDGR
jgi:predicted HTH domain antitoxin